MSEWYDEGIPSKEDIPSSGGTGGYAWWQRKNKDDEALPPRFWIPKDETKEISFIDDKCFRIFEHNFWIDNSPGYATCVAKRDSRGNPKKGTCPLCDAQNKAYHVGFFTIVDHTGYVKKKDNEEVKNYVALLPAKYYTLELLRSKFKKLKGIVGKRFSVTRTAADQAPTVGDDWDYMDKADVEEYEAVDYKEILQPYSMDEMKEIADIADWRGKPKGKSSSSSKKDDDDYSAEEDVSYEDDPGAVPF